MTTATKTRQYDIADINLAERGRFRMQWAAKEMPVLDLIEARFKKEQPFKGIRMAGAMHVTAETANLMRVLLAGGAEVALAASNPLSTQDDIAAALVSYYEMPVYAIKGETTDQYNSHLNSVLDMCKPHITMDDGMDLVAMLHTKRSNLLENVVGGTEETTTGVIRLRAMAAAGKLGLPRDRGQRRADQALLRQPLRHRPEHHRRHHPRHECAAGGQELCRRRLRLVQQGHCDARQGHGRQRHRHRGRAAQGARSGDGWLPRHADVGGGQDRPHLLQRHGRHARRRSATTWP
jgi:hypothetical protein